MTRDEALNATTDIARIDHRLSNAMDANELSNVMRDVRARLAVEHAPQSIIDAVDELERRHTGRVYIGGRAG
jgi:hypothetical protein